MAVTQSDLHQFQEFAKVVITQSGEHLTLDELWDRWRLNCPFEQEENENILAAKAAVRDMENGDLGIPVEQHLEEVRKKYNLPSVA
jgi:hypothetical protein